MHPGFLGWWKVHRGGPGFGMWSACGQTWADEWASARSAGEESRGGAWERGFSGGDAPSELGGGGFGVRRPLRFLAFKLGLDGDQVNRLAAILAELKTERAQAEVDRRRTLAAFADAVSAEAFDQPRATQGAALRTDSATRVGEAVLRALGRIHALLAPEQRERLAYLIRTGALQL